MVPDFLVMALGLGNGEQLKITFSIAHPIADQILRIVECDEIAMCLFSLVTNLNKDKPIDIPIRPNRNEYQLIGEKLFVNSHKYS